MAEVNITVPYGWEPRPYQLPAWEYLEAGGRRCILIWHRRAGKDSLSLNWTVTAALQKVGLYWHLFPTYNQGRKIIWNGMTKEGRPFLSYFPAELVKSTNKTDMTLELVNGSIYQVVGTDNVDRLVGANPIGVVLSEYALQDPRAWDLIRPILAENGGWAIFPYTPRGKNHGYERYRKAKQNPKWFAQVLTVDNTGAITKEAINEEKLDGMSEDMVNQEFFCSFEAGIPGAYFSSQMLQMHKEGRICKVPVHPELPVNTYWDLGIDDSMSIIFLQNVGREPHIIDYYERSGEGFPHYRKVLAEKGYMYGTHHGPHDLKVKELGSGKSRLVTARNMGIHFEVAKKIAHKEDGIEMSRNLLSRVWIDETRCEHLISCLENYHKEYDEKLKVFKEHPEHDWSCHGADAFQTLAQTHEFSKPVVMNRGVWNRAQRTADQVAGY